MPDLSSLKPYLRKVMAAVLDVTTSFVGFGYLVGFATGAVTEDGVSLSVIGAAVTFGLMAAYFVGFARLGGTPWQRFLSTSTVAGAG